jgi:hypothetical protein
MRITIALVVAAMALIAGLATSRMVRAQEPEERRAQYSSLCAGTPQALAAIASGRKSGSPLGGPFVHQDQVCILWRN